MPSTSKKLVGKLLAATPGLRGGSEDADLVPSTWDTSRPSPEYRHGLNGALKYVMTIITMLSAILDAPKACGVISASDPNVIPDQHGPFELVPPTRNAIFLRVVRLCSCMCRDAVDDMHLGYWQRFLRVVGRSWQD